MSVAISKKDAHRISVLIASACDPHSCIKHAREAGIYVTPIRDQVVELCLPLAAKMVGGVKLPPASRVERDDLEQAAAMAIIEGVDAFQPAMGVQIQTYLWMRMVGHVDRQCLRDHWTVMRPTRAEWHRFTRGQMTESEREAYLHRYVAPELHDATMEESW